MVYAADVILDIIMFRVFARTSPVVLPPSISPMVAQRVLHALFSISIHLTQEYKNASACKVIKTSSLLGPCLNVDPFVEMGSSFSRLKSVTIRIPSPKMDVIKTAKYKTVSTVDLYSQANAS